MAQQTAVEWLQIKMATSSPQEMVENINVWFKEAKQMEKEQIMNAVERGFNVGCYHPRDRSLKNAEQYYNETYTK